MEIFVKIVLLYFWYNLISCNQNESYTRRQGRTLKGKDYCSVKCHETLHVACQFKGDCSQANTPCKFVSLDNKKILARHNELRNFYALGKEPVAEGTQTADMMVLNWDDELARLAECNLKSCPKDMTHDNCHTTDIFATSGQNIYHKKSTGELTCTNLENRAVDAWYEEVKLLNAEQIKALAESYEPVEGTGHFTQLVWSLSTHVGCAVTQKKDDKWECMLTCNYGPAGNWKTRNMIKIGEATSACPNGEKRNDKYPGLCGKGGAYITEPNIKLPILTIYILFLSIFVKY